LWWEKGWCITFMWTFLLHRLLFVLCMQIDIMSVRIGVFLVLQAVWMEYLYKIKPWYDTGILKRELFN